ncbi:MAG: hypothetical protein RIM72_14870 [Alphaproteobacteria bacterium]
MRSVLVCSYALLALSISVPAGVVLTRTDVAAVIGGFTASEDNITWVYSPAFAVRDSNGATSSYSIAFRLSDRSEVNNLCKWMPVIRDSVNSALGATPRTFLADGKPDTRPIVTDLKKRIHTILVQHKTKQIGIVPADKVPAMPDGPEAVTVCYNDRVYEAGRRGPNTLIE